jgi:hypothetical protein
MSVCALFLKDLDPNMQDSTVLYYHFDTRSFAPQPPKVKIRKRFCCSTIELEEPKQTATAERSVQFFQGILQISYPNNLEMKNITTLTAGIYRNILQKISKIEETRRNPTPISEAKSDKETPISPSHSKKTLTPQTPSQYEETKWFKSIATSPDIDITNEIPLFSKSLIIKTLYRARLGCVNFNHAASPIEENV